MVSRALFLAILACLPRVALMAQATDTLTLSVALLGRTVGREVTVRRRDAAGTRLESELSIIDRGGTFGVKATLQLDASGGPMAFEASGRSYRFVVVDVSVARSGDSVTVRSGDRQERVGVSGPWQPVMGYAPLAARASVIATWDRAGRPAWLGVLPGPRGRHVVVTERGGDSVNVRGRTVRLRRFDVEGAVWGRETVWLDERGDLAAIVTRVHILPLTAVREELRDAFPALARRATSDRMRDLARWRDVAGRVADGAYALTGATIIDMTGAAPLNDATLIVRGSRIVGIGPRDGLAIPRGVRAIDARGTTIIPGMWDMHAHAAQIEWAPAYLAAGVTTIRDMGGDAPFLMAWRDAQRRERALSPTMILTGLVDGDTTAAFGTVTAATTARGRAVVERYHVAGIRQMKLYTMLPADVTRAIIDRAHALGMAVTGHVPRSLGLAGAIAAGMDQVAHLPLTGDPGSPDIREAIAALAARKVVVDPTLPWNEVLGRSESTDPASFEPGLRSVAWPLAASYASVRNRTTPDEAAASLRAQLAAVKALHDAGVPIVAGTDGAVQGHSLLRFLELLVDAGLSPMEALRSATVVSARAMGMERTSGTIEAGKVADFVVLDGNPLESIGNVRRTRWVSVRGRLYASRDLWRLAGFEPAR